MSRAGWSTLWSRRAALSGLLGLGGCGFRPLHGPVESSDAAGTADIAQDLAAVRVSWMGDRFGVMLRRTLQRKLESEATGVQARYTLAVAISMSGEALGYRRDGSISRIRYIVTSNWNLETLSVPPRSIGRSTMPVRMIDAFNVPDLQFFSADTSREAMEGRIADHVADEIYREVTMALRKFIADGRPGLNDTPAATPRAS